MKSKQTVLLKIFSEKKWFNKIDCNVSGAVKLALTEANTQKTSQGIFGIFVTLWQINNFFFFFKKVKTVEIVYLDYAYPVSLSV